jgi:hypothetical protein
MRSDGMAWQRVQCNTVHIVRVRGSHLTLATREGENDRLVGLA